jgi:hypothetical protein
MPAAYRKIRLLGRQLDRSHLDNNLEPSRLECLANAIVAAVVDACFVIGFGEYWVTNTLPFKLFNVLDVSQFVHQLIRSNLTVSVDWSVS